MNDLESLILLNSVDGLGPRRIKNLLDRFKKPSLILKADKKDFYGIEGISEKIISGIKSSEKNFDIKKEFDLLKKHNVKVITIFDKNYPKNLKEIYDAPSFLYVKGNILESDDISIAVVGSRRASLYGISACERISFELASKGITIVSGLARGIDTASHMGAIKAKGRTIAVLGNGLSFIYPPENKGLAEEISENGAVISELPMEAHPDRMNFPRRNRIISGLSLGVLVVEAAKKSGALITADFALGENRDVFAMPGKVDSITSQGTHNLIKEGAKLVENADDIILELKDKIADFLKNSDPKASGAPKVVLEKGEDRIYGLLSKDEAVHIDEIVANTDLPVNTVSGMLVNLRIRNLVKELPGKKYILNN